MKINLARIMVLTLAGEQGMIASVYAYQRDWRMMVYWTACTVLSVTMGTL